MDLLEKGEVMEALKRVGNVLLAGTAVVMLFMVFMFGMSCFAVLFPLVIVASAVWYCIKYIVTGEDGDGIFR